MSKSGYTKNGVPNWKARQLLKSLLNPDLVLFKCDVESIPVGGIWVHLVMDGYASLDGATGEDGMDRNGMSVFDITPKGRWLLQQHGMLT